jgi:ATP-dependent helicase/nuclease subunit B
LTTLGLEAGVLAGARESLERGGLRGPRPETFADLLTRLNEAPGAARDLAERLGAALVIAQAPFVDPASDDGIVPPAAAARALVAALEYLAAERHGGSRRLWTGAAGESLARLLSALIRESDALPPVGREAFARLLAELLAAESLRPGGASHPRLRILGVLEARLLRADRIILAGLEEGVWPQGAPIDPFLSRPMRAALGLPAPERRIGLSAHDFAQAASAPEVVLIQTLRRGPIWRTGRAALMAPSPIRRPPCAPRPGPPPGLRSPPGPGGWASRRWSNGCAIPTGSMPGIF